ncbi:subunit ASH2 of Set1/Ash2 histone methyltransferase complex [Hamiltosporidium magnivora]|uniref:Subunit ASH2 of Set1/Ash2 histone methyltransferase complex n=1 Tax=Hamiltosporidium magnivora TaxID=148818 RepID=A0A4Q9KWT6_9MICR|nr:subunit ASH2 of Set1/Ash2 histone methyltransferase complex [Hamiltosporidium magnivora]
MNLLDQRRTPKICISSELSHGGLEIYNNNLSLKGYGGYRSALSTHGLLSGNFYYEAQIESKSGNIRLGFGQKNTDIYAPAGYDKYSYSYGDANGYIFHNSVRKTYSDTYKYKDIIGVLLSINTEPTVLKDYTRSTLVLDSSLKFVSRFSFIKFFKNGEDLGIAFSNINPGIYHAVVSLYCGGEVSLNFGPFFAYPIDNHI